MLHTWKPVVGYEDFYEVNGFGEVRSLSRRVGARGGGTRVRKPKILSVFLNEDGYHRVRLTDAEGKKKFKHVHHLVAQAFLGPKPPGLLVLHNDDDKNRNEADNLYYGTSQDNADDRMRNGKHRSGVSLGEKHGQSKLKERDIFTVFELIEGGVPYRQIGLRFGMTDMPIHNIVRGRNWGWFTGQGAI